MANKLILDPKTKTHYAINLHEALCGSGWLQAAGSIEDITCPECKRLLTLPAPDKGDSPAPEKSTTPEGDTAAEHEPTPAPCG